MAEVPNINTLKNREKKNNEKQKRRVINKEQGQCKNHKNGSDGVVSLRFADGVSQMM